MKAERNACWSGKQRWRRTHRLRYFHVDAVDLHSLTLASNFNPFHHLQSLFIVYLNIVHYSQFFPLSSSLNFHAFNFFHLVISSLPIFPNSCCRTVALAVVVTFNSTHDANALVCLCCNLPSCYPFIVRSLNSADLISMKRVPSLKRRTICPGGTA